MNKYERNNEENIMRDVFVIKVTLIVVVASDRESSNSDDMRNYLQNLCNYLRLLMMKLTLKWNKFSSISNEW